MMEESLLSHISDVLDIFDKIGFTNYLELLEYMGRVYYRHNNATIQEKDYKQGGISFELRLTYELKDQIETLFKERGFLFKLTITNNAYAHWKYELKGVLIYTGLVKTYLDDRSQYVIKNKPKQDNIPFSDKIFVIEGTNGNIKVTEDILRKSSSEYFKSYFERWNNRDCIQIPFIIDIIDSYLYYLSYGTEESIIRLVDIAGAFEIAKYLTDDGYIDLILKTIAVKIKYYHKSWLSLLNDILSYQPNNKFAIELRNIFDPDKRYYLIEPLLTDGSEFLEKVQEIKFFNFGDSISYTGVMDDEKFLFNFRLQDEDTFLNQFYVQNLNSSKTKSDLEKWIKLKVVYDFDFIQFLHRSDMVYEIVEKDSKIWGKVLNNMFKKKGYIYPQTNTTN